MVKILKRVAVEVTYPDGRMVKGVSYEYPEHTKQVIYQIWTDEPSAESMLINLHLAESVKLTPTFEK